MAEGQVFRNDVDVLGDIAIMDKLYMGLSGQTGTFREIQAQGASGDISIDLIPKGNGLINVPTGYETLIGTNDRGLINRGYFKSYILGLQASATAQAPGAGQDQYAILYDHATTKWDLKPVALANTYEDGITKTGTIVRLGGDIDESVTNVRQTAVGDIYIQAQLGTGPAGIKISSVTNNDNRAELFYSTTSAITLSNNTFVVKANVSGAMKYADDYSGLFVSRSIPDVSWVNTHIGGKNVHTTITNPTGVEDGWVIKWDQTNNRYTLGVVPGVTFLSLSDTPSSYSGQALKFVRVNAAETGLEFTASAGGSKHIIQNSGSSLPDRTNLNFTGGLQAVDDSGNNASVVSIANDGVTTVKILNSNVTLAKIQNIASDRLIGRDAPASGVATEISVTGGIEFTGSDSIQISAFTGDVTKTAGGTVLTIANDAVTDAKLRDSAALSVIGRATNTSGNPADIVAGANDRILRRVSDTLDFGQLTVGMAPDNLWTYAKLQQVSANRLLGNPTGSAANVTEISLGTGLEFSGGALGISSSYTGQFWSLASGGALTGDNTISGSFNVGFTNNAVGIGVAPGSITANTKLDLRGSGAATNFIERLADGSNVVRRTTQNNGVFSVVSAAKLSEWSTSFTADSNNDIGFRFSGSLTGTATNNNQLHYIRISPTLIFGTYTTGTSTVINLLNLSPIWDASGVTGTGVANSIGVRYSPSGVVTQTHTAIYIETGKVIIGGSSSVSISSSRMLEITAPSGTNILRLYGISGSPVQRFDVTGDGQVSSVTEHGVTSGVASGTKMGYSLTLNATGATSGSSITRGYEVIGTINNSGSFTGEYIGYLFNPNLTGITGMSIYAFIAVSGLSGFGVSNPTARVQVRGVGTTTAFGMLIEANDDVDTFGFRDDGKFFHYITPSDASTGHQLLLRNNTTGEITKLGIGTNLSIGSGNLNASGGGGGVTVNEVEVNFGPSSAMEYDTFVSVADTSITASSKIVCTLAAKATSDHDIDDIVATSITLYAGDPTPGVGFKIFAKCEEGTYGKYKVNYFVNY